ncbi:MAG: hypothetical protein R2844_15080 [Caldilineales bacterium]
MLSETTVALVCDDLPEGVHLLNMGRHQLKDMRRPEQIQQLAIDGMPRSSPPLNSLVSLGQPVLAADGNGVREPRTVGACRPTAAWQPSASWTKASSLAAQVFTGQLVDSVRQQGLVAVIVGPSGSGKSSVVFAGLLPLAAQRRLAAGNAAPRWTTVPRAKSARCCRCWTTNWARPTG